MNDRFGDTRKLLRECDAGIKMGISSLDDVMNSVSDCRLEKLIKDGKKEHEQLRVRAENYLNRINDKGKAPNPIATAMSHAKTKTVTAFDKSDRAVARLVGKGCDMGVKSLGNYIEKYAAADQSCVQLADDIITAEKRLSESLEPYMQQ
ncbi:MAG: hypothetical protein ACI4Q6_07575 [Huintestinicola sp.]